MSRASAVHGTALADQIEPLIPPLPADGRVVVVGNYGNRNLGDEATLAVLLHQIRRRRPDVSVVAVSFDPTDTSTRHNVAALPARASIEPSSDGAESAVALVLRRCRRFLASARLWQHYVSTLRRSDWLIFGGGGQVDDQFGGPAGAPLRMFLWACLARVSGCTVIFLNVGVGPLTAPLSRRLAAFALGLAKYRAFRDAESMELVTSLGVRHAGVVLPDLAFGIESHRTRRGSSARGRVAINVFPHHDDRYWPQSRAETYERYIAVMSSFAGWVMHLGYDLTFVPTQLTADPSVISDVLNRLGQAGVSLSVATVATLDDLLDVLADADWLVATRFHGALLAFVVGTPVLALSNHQKLDSLMRDMNQSEHLLQMEDLSLARLQTAFQRLVGESDSSAFSQRRERHAAEIRTQFDALLPSIE